MYWWQLVNLSKTELLNKFYKAQKMSPNKGDWIEQLEKDKNELDLQLGDDEIQKFTQEQLRRIVNEKIEICPGKFLKERQKSHSKTQNIEFDGFKPAKYLLTRNLMIKEVQTLFSLRTRMVDVKANFSSANTNNMWCKLCHLCRPRGPEHELCL